jgi:4-hydroxy-2-oxoheptanedioate aldolase
MDNALRRLFAGNLAFRALFNGIPSPALAEMAGYAGFDLLILDNEHGSADLQATEHQLRAARSVGLPAIVRCLEHDIARVLDMGAAGVQIPMVRDAEHARELVERVHYPLRAGEAGLGGLRGSAFSTRAAGYGALGGDGHTARSRESVCLVAMIETPEAVAQAAQIASVPGIDAVFVGPNDLSHNMGYGSDWRHPQVQAQIGQALRNITAQGVCAGTLALTHEDESRYHSWGARFFANVSTALITQAFARAAQAHRSAHDESLRY